MKQQEQRCHCSVTLVMLLHHWYFYIHVALAVLHPHTCWVRPLRTKNSSVQKIAKWRLHFILNLVSEVSCVLACPTIQEDLWCTFTTVEISSAFTKYSGNKQGSCFNAATLSMKFSTEIREKITKPHLGTEASVLLKLLRFDCVTCWKHSRVCSEMWPSMHKPTIHRKTLKSSFLHHPLTELLLIATMFFFFLYDLLFSSYATVSVI